MKRIHLICNAHLDPVWLWEKDEGIAAAISTFRTAAEICEEQENAFIFNHNESLLYGWIEEYEPTLFIKIQDLVKRGKWHIMGGWFLQPDCNMPSGESICRQIEKGQRYFEEKFGVTPTTAINFDPFGHSRGLVQILNKYGYDSYLFCRPDPKLCKLPDDDFIWKGFDGSTILAHRAYELYNSMLGQVIKKVDMVLENNKDKDTICLLWGVGNHGGGPSRQDIKTLNEFIESYQGGEVIHSTPESYFQDLALKKESLPIVEEHINPFAIGCYTSQIRIKQKHRALENLLYSVEKMYAHAQVEGLLADDYSKEIRSAEETLLFSEFHDILPGSSIGIVEESSLDALGHGIETMKRLRSRLFFSLSIGMDKAKTGEIPILVYNPHPYPVSQVVECEFQLADQNWEDTVFDISVRGKGGMLPSQVEKEDSNIPLDWRKKVSFTAHLEPSSMNRFDCELSRVEPDQLYLKEQDFEVHTEDLDIRIDPKTGHIDYYKLGDKDFLERQSAKALVVGDTVDAWAMTDHSYGDIEGCFELMSPQESAKFCALTHETVLSPVRIVEDGAVRKIIEADMKYKDSTLNVRYVIPKVGSEIELELRVYWNEKDKILKWDFPLSKSIDLGVVQTMFGTQELDKNGQEGVQHKWCMAQNIENDLALSIINEGIYGVDIRDQSLRLSLVRSPGYSAHTIEDRLIMRQDRFSPRIDQGERSFKIWLNGGTLLDRKARIEIEAQAKNEAPMAVAAFPSALGKRSGKGLRLSNSKVVCSSIQLLSDDVCQIRLYNSSDSDQNCFIKWDEFGPIEDLAFGPFEFKILKLTRA